MKSQHSKVNLDDILDLQVIFTPLLTSSYLLTYTFMIDAAFDLILVIPVINNIFPLVYLAIQ